MAKKTIVNEVASAVGTAAGAAAARMEGLKPKRGTTGKHSKAKVSAVEEATAAEPVAVDQTEVARLAYLYWEARGGQGGSPEQDWILAEQQLTAKAAG
jgi:hypothetical protein